jgi:hypothetical protein
MQFLRPSCSVLSSARPLLNLSLTRCPSLAHPPRPCQPSSRCFPGGDEGTRTPDLCLAKAPLSHLSYVPRSSPVGLSRLERLTSRLSGECSNQLSYRPVGNWPSAFSLQKRQLLPCRAAGSAVSFQPFVCIGQSPAERASILPSRPPARVPARRTR